MGTLSGGCGTTRIRSFARCARQRLAARGASTLFVATMHRRDRQTLEDELQPSSSHASSAGVEAAGTRQPTDVERRVRVVHLSTGRASERIVSNDASHEEARVLDVWLLSRGYELLLSPGSTMGYLAMALAPEATPLYMLDTCAPPPMREAAFHRLQKALSSGGPPCKPRASGIMEGAPPRVRALWERAERYSEF
jgi:hypothetical protein